MRFKKTLSEDIYIVATVAWVERLEYLTNSAFNKELYLAKKNNQEKY